METITFQIPLTKKNLEFISKTLSEAEALGMPVESYQKQVQQAQLAYEIEAKEQEVIDLKALQEELSNG